LNGIPIPNSPFCSYISLIDPFLWQPKLNTFFIFFPKFRHALPLFDFADFADLVGDRGGNLIKRLGLGRLIREPSNWYGICGSGG
jgi:hypothetical protein